MKLTTAPLITALLMASALQVVAKTEHVDPVPPEVIDRGWKAQVELSGDGDPNLAVTRIRELTDLQSTVFQGIEYHPQTRTFLDQMWSNLESFNLNEYYSKLPEQEGDWRQLRVYGTRDGKRYVAGPDIRQGALPGTLGDVAVVVKARKIEGDKGQHYLLRNSMQVGLGELQWPSMQDAASETFKLIVDGAPQFQGKVQPASAQVYRDYVLRMNPALGREDVDVLAPLWASFPAMWSLLSRLGTIDDVIYHDQSLPYRNLKATFSLDLNKMKQAYPGLAGHLEDMNRLFDGNLRVLDERGELFSMELDSRTLRGHFSAFIADGKILPVKGGEVVLNPDSIPEGKPWNFMVDMNSTMNILGVVTHISNAKARVQYLSNDTGFKLVGQLSDVPSVQVQGNALGIMPTAMIDVVMPSSMAEIIQDFMGVACKGNEGKGVLLGAQFEQGKPGETSILTLKSAFEGLDNFFVRVGMGIVNDRVLPNEKASSEFRQLIYDTQTAFASDLKGFEENTLNLRDRVASAESVTH